jgi:colanic acid biosynthesis glycosyl transferase WcaI
VRILFLNQYAPPDPAPTAQLVGQLADALRRDGHEVQIIGTKQRYRSHRKNLVFRLIRELNAIAGLLVSATKADRPDVVISTSSPPGLLVVGVVVAKLRRARSIHWAMDLYPELVFRLGKRWPRLIEDFLYSLIGATYRQNDELVTLDKDMRAHLRQRYRVDASIIRPWVLQSGLPDLAPFPDKAPFFWIYSGNLGRAHEWSPLLEAQAILESHGLPIFLVFQGDGASRAKAQEVADAARLKQVQWRNYAADSELIESLLRAHVFVVTQKLCVQGLLWPSKLSLLKKLPRPLVFVGPTDGAIAEEVSMLPEGAAFEPTEGSSLAAHIEKLFVMWPPKFSPVVDAADEFPEAYRAWRAILEASKRPLRPITIEAAGTVNKDSNSK